MGILFENTYFVTQENAKDFMRYWFFRRPAMLVLHIFSPVLIGLSIYGVITGNNELASGFMFYSFFYILVFVNYFRSQKIYMRRENELQQSPREITVIVTEEGIIHKSSTGTNLHLNYSDIKKVVSTKQFVYLLTRAKFAYCLKNDSFTVGDKEDFESFIKKRLVK